MTWKTSLAIVATSLILAGPAAAQTPTAPGRPGIPTPGTPSPPTPGLPGSTTPGTGTPGATPPGLPGNPTPGSPSINNPSSTNPTFPCPPGQARRPGSPACIPGPTTK